MTWVRLDDGFAQHPKVIGLSDPGFRMHAGGLCYCGRHRTDGVVSVAALLTLYPRSPMKVAAELIAAGIWHEPGHACPSCPDVAPGSLYIHDFLRYNPSAQELDDAASERSEKARRAARARWDAPGNAPSIDGASAVSMLGDAPSRPVPTHSVNSSSTQSHAVGCQPEDDDEELRIEAIARDVLERAAKSRMNGKQVREPKRYLAKVVAELDGSERGGVALRKTIAGHPDAPLDPITGWLLGEQNSLHLYRADAS